MSHVEEMAFEPNGTGDEYAGEVVIHTAARNESHTIQGLLQHMEGQPVHVGTPKVNLGTRPGWDYAQTIRDDARARQYEWLLVELRLNGRVHGTPKIIHLKPRTETLDLPPAPRDYYGPQYQQQQPGDLDARIMRSVRHALGGDLHRARPRHFARARARVYGRRRDGQRKQGGGDYAALVFQLYQESAARERALMTQLIDARTNPQTAPRETVAEDTEAAALRMLVSDPVGRRRLLSGISKFFDSDESERSTVAEIGDLLSEHGDKLPLVGAAIREALSGVGSLFGRAPQQQPGVGVATAPRPALRPAPPQPTAPAAAPVQQPTEQPIEQPTAAPPSFMTEADAVMNGTFDDLRDSVPVFASARDFAALWRDYPAEIQQVKWLLDYPPATVCATIAGLLPQAAEIVKAAHAEDWIGRWQRQVRKKLGQMQLLDNASDAPTDESAEASAAAEAQAS